jgi:hypothetical protein
MGLSRARTFLASNIKGLHAEPPRSERDDASIVFDYEGKSIRIGGGATHATGSQIVDAIVQKFPHYGREA